MWTQNPDTGQWTQQTDSLSKDYYDSLKQDLQAVKLYSKCLSGSTYLPINRLDDIYDALKFDKEGFYINESYNTVVYPTNGPQIPLNSSSSDEFYQKYLKENAFTIKNLFTPNKLINDQEKNYVYVDVATTETISNIGQTQIGLTIDGVFLLEGHRILVKDQFTEITLSSTTDPELYFSSIILTSGYEKIEDFTTEITYRYYNSENGIYIFSNNKLVRESDLDTYNGSYRHSVSVKLGNSNMDKQFHLMRLKNGYFPTTGENIQYSEKHNWLLRNRVDYNNLFEISYSDILHHSAQTLIINGVTYSIPERTIAVGNFGVILNNQDQLSISATFSKSSIINNKYKVNLNSIAEVNNYYWICGDEGTLLKVSKIDFTIERIELNETSNLTSISFFGNLNGMVVGKYNTIYWTSDGGFHWKKLTFNGFDIYSWNKVVQYDFNHAYIGGEAGNFIELNWTNNQWIAYKRKVAKQLNSYDEYILVEDINDMFKTNWTTIRALTYSYNQNVEDFASNLVYQNRLSDRYQTLELTIDSKYFGEATFSNSEFYIAFQIQSSTGSTIYQNSNFTYSSGSIATYSSWDIWQFATASQNLTYSITLPQDVDGNLLKDDYIIKTNVVYNYDIIGGTASILPGYLLTNHTWELKAIDGRILLIVTNNDNIIAYDIDRCLSLNNNQFVYLGTSQSHTDIKAIIRRPNSTELYIGGDFLYKLDFKDFRNIGNIDTNLASGTSSLYKDIYVNKLFSAQDYLYTAGNYSTLLTHTYSSSNFYQLDPTFNDTLKSRMLFLDYDIASKLNWFDPDRQYRLPNSITFSWLDISSDYFDINNLPGEYNWLNYYKDSEKTFRYYSSMTDSDKVLFSSTFSKATDIDSFIFTGSDITTNLDDILPLAPSLSSPTASRYTIGTTVILGPTLAYSIYIYKWLLILKISGNSDINVGDVLNFNSDIINCNLLVNRKDTYGSDVLIYCYSDFNQNIISNLKYYTGNIFITNLNKYNNVTDIIERFNSHPISFGYKLTLEDNNIFTLSPRFNNKTAYYNLQSNVTLPLKPGTGFRLNTNVVAGVITSHSISSAGSGYTSSQTFTVDGGTISASGTITSVGLTGDVLTYTLSYPGSGYTPSGTSVRTTTPGTISFKTTSMVYTDSFLKFGYSPTFNILDYLSMISPVFNPTKQFVVLPQYTNLPGNNAGSFTSNNIYIDVNLTQGTNKLLFGTNFKFQWESLLINTFVDIITYSDPLLLPPLTPTNVTTNRALIISKYFDTTLNGYVIEFNKKVEIPKFTYGVTLIDIISRNTLQEISDDLQLLNNIQRTSTTKQVQYLQTFTNLENELKSKFPTESYFKALISDYDVKQNISAVIYSDLDNQIALNIVNVDREFTYDILSTSSSSGNLLLTLAKSHTLQIGDTIVLNFNGGTFSSEYLNTSYFGYQTILGVPASNQIVTSKSFGTLISGNDPGKLSYTKKDPFFNYQPIDLFNLGIDKQVTRSVEIKPENFELVGATYSLINLDLNKYKFQFVDGLYLEEVNKNFSWLLEAEISDAIIGRDANGPIWYSGTWKCGRWFGGTWISGKWISGDWYDGIWKAFNNTYKVISVEVNTSYVDDTISKWYNGRWFGGTWSGGTWYNGRRYTGDWLRGFWYNGTWNDGHWFNGQFQGGIWVSGTWESGTFNCNSKPAYWLDGSFKSGDFENGIWYNGNFGNQSGLLSRFGTKSTNSRTSTWNGGKWINGEFHSNLNIDSQTGLATVSEIHKYSIWKTGIWFSGDFYGGIAYAIDFKNGIWHGGIIEEIQITGVSKLIPANTSPNQIFLNGIFRYNIGDDIYILDDYSGGAYSPIGNNDNPGKYRINLVRWDLTNNVTTVNLNYNLSSLGITTSVASQTYSNYETGLRAVSHFKDSTWKSGVWTNGIFEGGNFESGIWYSGVFNGTWGN